MPSFLDRLLDDTGFAPHGYCLMWREDVLYTHVVSDALIGLSYFSIPIALAYFLTKRRDMVFSGIVWLFATFIMACGATHFFGIWTLWYPDYGAEAVLKAGTALVSVFTAAALWPLIPKALALPSPAQLQLANEGLWRTVAERDTALADLERETNERIAAQEMLRQSQKMEAVGQLTGGIAHDFNNLLTVVIANLDRARRLPPGDARLARALESASVGAERAAMLTDQLLAFARRQPLHAERVEVTTLIEDARPLLEGALGDAVVLDIAVDPDTAPVEVDINSAHNALLNLAVNARDVMPGGGRLTIRASNRGDHVAIEVSDTGPGMDEAVRARVFEPFFTTKPVGQGTGLGLAQVYGFASQAGGTAEVVSALGEGTTVRLLLPRVPPGEETR